MINYQDYYLPLPTEIEIVNLELAIDLVHFVQG